MPSGFGGALFYAVITHKVRNRSIGPLRPDSANLVVSRPDAHRDSILRGMELTWKGPPRGSCRVANLRLGSRFAPFLPRYDTDRPLAGPAKL